MFMRTSDMRVCERASEAGRSSRRAQHPGVTTQFEWGLPLTPPSACVAVCRRPRSRGVTHIDFFRASSIEGCVPWCSMNNDGKVDGTTAMEVEPSTDRIEDPFPLIKRSDCHVLCDISTRRLLRNREGRHHFVDVWAPLRGTKRVPCACGAG